MATVTSRGGSWLTAAGAKSTASFTPAAGELLVAVVGIAGTDTAPTMSDTDSSITGWTLVNAFRSHGAAVTGGLRIYVSNQGASGSPITVTMTPGAADTGGGLQVLSVTSPSAYGASAVRSSGAQADQATGTPAPVLSLTPLSTNPVLIAVMTNTNGTANAAPRTATTPDYTEATDVGMNSPATGLEVQYINAGETSATLTTGGATPSGFAAIGIEVDTVAPTNWSQPVNDAAAGTDAQAKGATSPKADAIAGTDATSRLWAALRTQPDAIAGTDAIAKTATHSVADAATVTDAIDAQLAAGEYEQPVDDSIAGTDATARVWTAARTQPDAMAGTDAQAKASTHPLADTAAGTDARASSVGHALADPIAGTDTATRRVGSARADTIAGTDTRASVSAKAFADTVAGTDAQARVWAAKLTVADGLSATDDIDSSAAGANEQNIDDSAAVVDAISVSLGTRRTLGDSVAVTDALGTQANYARQPVDAVAVTDVLARAWTIIETQADGLQITDTTLARIPAARWLPDTDGDWEADSDEEWPADADEDWEAQTDDRWLVSAESRW